LKSKYNQYFSFLSSNKHYTPEKHLQSSFNSLEKNKLKFFLSARLNTNKHLFNKQTISNRVN